MASAHSDVSIVVFETASGHQIHQTVASTEDIDTAASLAPPGTVMLYFYTPHTSLRQKSCREANRSKLYFINPRISGNVLRINQDWRPPRFVTYDETQHGVIETDRST